MTSITAAGPSRPSRGTPRWRGLLFLVPSAVIIAVFVLWPIVQSLWMSLHDWSFFQKTHEFIGVGNYLELLGDPRFWNALSNTAIFTVVTVPVQIALGLLLAIKLSRARWWSVFLRSVFFFPVISSFATMAIVWKFMLSPDVGPTASWLRDVGLTPIAPLQDPNLALAAIILVGLWKNIGFTMVILIAAMQDVPEDLMEAAALDGAGPWRRFLSVSLPSIRQALLFASIIAVIASLQVFDQVYVMTGGGPLFRTETLVTYMYDQGFKEFRSGYAAALAWVLFLIIMAISVLQLRIFRYRDVD
jgi:ABC-type sugar transport system permease subunit